MIKRFIILLLAAFTILELQAQSMEKCGTSYNDAIPVAFSKGINVFTDLRDTSTGPPHYYPCRYVPRDGTTYSYTQGGAIFYQMELASAGDVIIHNWNSYRMGFSTIFLLRLTKSGEKKDWSEGGYSFKRVLTFEPGDFMSEGFDPVELGKPEGASLGLAYIRVRNLPAGIYFIVTAGYKYMNGSVPNGKLGTTIIADLSSTIPDEPETTPEDPNNCPIQYQYDSSGNRIKTIKKQ